MIPTMLLVGFAAGAMLRTTSAALVGLACAVLWGVFVVSDGGGVGEFFGGVAIGAANFVVGAAVGSACRWVWDHTHEARNRA